MPYVQNHRLESVLARGSTTEIWAAVRQGPGGFAAPVALKTLLGPHVGSARHVRAFVHEARAASYVQHRNVVQTRELMCEDGRYWLSMERVRGWSVRSLMATLAARGQTIPVEVAVALARDAAAGVQAIHDAGLIHRNLTPDNLMIASSGHLVVLDFGSASWQLSERVRYTAPLAPIDPIYASPQMRASQPLDPRTDVYSLGALLHELIPRRPDVPAALDGIIAHALEPGAGARFATARELEIVLELVSIRERWPVTASYVAAYLTEAFAGTELADAGRPPPVPAHVAEAALPGLPPRSPRAVPARAAAGRLPGVPAPVAASASLGDSDDDDLSLPIAPPDDDRETDPVIHAAPARSLPAPTHRRPASTAPRPAAVVPRRFVQTMPRTASGSRGPPMRAEPSPEPAPRRAPTRLGTTRVRLLRR